MTSSLVARDFAFLATALGVRELAGRFFTFFVVTGAGLAAAVDRLALESLLDLRTDIVAKERTSIQTTPLADLRLNGPQKR
jgi:hypothetical protein